MREGSPRPWWMTAMAAFCLASLALNVPRDLLFEEFRRVEVWGGFELRGEWALLTAPLHWAIFAVGAWAFWTGRRWIVPLAAAYAFYVAASHLVWSETSPHGRGWRIGLLQMAALSLPGFLLLRGHASLRRAERDARSRGATRDYSPGASEAPIATTSVGSSSSRGARPK